MRMRLISLEPAAEKLCLQRENVFVPTTIGLTVLREQLEFEQQQPVYIHPVKFRDVEVALSSNLGSLPVRLYFPDNLKPNEKVPTIFYIHGGQFVTGSLFSHDKLLRELVYRTHAAAVFPQYALAPEKKAPFQLQQLAECFLRLPELSKQNPLSLKRLLLVGDDVGGGMAVSLAIELLQKQLASPIYKLLLFYPVVNANFETSSYHQFAGGYDLTREQMKWCWQQYLATTEQKLDPHFSPLLATFAQLRQLPETLIITAEADPTRDEGEALARKLRDAGGRVAQIRFQGIIHDFVTKNQLDKTNACRLAMNIAVDWLKKRSK